MEYLNQKSSDYLVISGFPSVSGVSSQLETELCFSISDKCKNKDIAWKFIRQFFTEDYQQSLISDRTAVLPVKKSAYEKLMNIDQIDEKSQTYTDSVDKMIKSITKPLWHIDKIEEIINEETTEYFNGNISAQKTAENIQSRASIFMSERY